jgi:pimeloyl-ACP methyl ester carboxylesterase
MILSSAPSAPSGSPPPCSPAALGLAAASVIGFILALTPGAGAAAASGVGNAHGAAAAPAASPGARRAREPWEGKLRPCKLPEVQGGADCGSFEVFENREAAAGRKIALQIAVLPALGPNPAPDPIFILSGGPGEGALSTAPELSRDALRQRRDIVLIDTRGTGGSNPLSCAIWGDGTRLDHIFPSDAVRKCLDELQKKADLTRYTTAAAMDDVEDVRRWLGYDRIDLSGGSYGTLAAQVFVTRHPEHVRSVVMVGIAKPGDPSPLYHARNAQHALELLGRDCARDAACHAAFPHFLDEVSQVLARLAKQPVRVQIKIEDKPKPATVTLTRSAAAEAIRFSLYSAMAGHLPLVIHQAAGGDYSRLADAAVELRAALQEDLAFGLMFSVTCSEDVSRIDPREVPAATAGTFYGDERVRDQLAACAVWPHAPKPPGSGALPPSPVPALLLSGERDPVTPAADAALVAGNFPHGLLVVIPSGAHSAADSPCVQHLIGDFLERGTAQGLDTSCVRKVAPIHFDTR